MGGGKAPQKVLLSAVRWAAIGESSLITFILPMMSWCGLLILNGNTLVFNTMRHHTTDSNFSDKFI